jgi:RNA polymerase sigma factor (sigma-70 family)
MAAPISNFRALIERCFAGPEQHQAIEDLCTAIRPHLLVTLISLSRHNVELAEDALQNAFVKIIQLFRTRTRPFPMVTEAYLVTIAKNCLIDELRRQKHHVNIDELIQQDLLPIGQSDQSGEYIREELVLLALNRLDPKCQYLLESYYIGNAGIPELATILGIAPPSVYMTMKRCRGRLREILLPYLSLVDRTREV